MPKTKRFGHFLYEGEIMMESKPILLERFPAQLKELIIQQKAENILDYFFTYDLEEQRLAEHLSRYACHVDYVELHDAAAMIYANYFNYVDDAFHTAFFHEWRALELTEFKDAARLRRFMENKDHPDYDMISAEHYGYVQQQLQNIS